MHVCMYEVIAHSVWINRIDISPYRDRLDRRNRLATQFSKSTDSDSPPQSAPVRRPKKSTQSAANAKRDVYNELQLRLSYPDIYTSDLESMKRKDNLRSSQTEISRSHSKDLDNAENRKFTINLKNRQSVPELWSTPIEPEVESKGNRLKTARSNVDALRTEYLNREPENGSRVLTEDWARDAQRMLNDIACNEPKTEEEAARMIGQMLFRNYGPYWIVHVTRSKFAAAVSHLPRMFLQLKVKHLTVIAYKLRYPTY